MTLSFEMHRALEALLGLALVVLSLLAVGELVTIVPACLVGLALTTLGFAASREGRTLDADAHRAFDLILVAVLAVAAVVSYVADAPEGAALLLMGAALLLVLWAFTEYSKAREADGAVAVTTGGDANQE